ncbi:MAG: Tab2/Atab2 family RNA-binding protein, partial [Waterburya sp.]
MNIWQADFYYLPSQTTNSEKQWELVICDANNINPDNYPKQPIYTAQCSSKDAN